MEHIIPISDLQSKAKYFVDQVQKTEEPVFVTRRGRAAAVLVSCGMFEGWRATIEEMAYPDWKKRLGRAKIEARRNKTVSLDSYLKKRAFHR